jgi:carbon-monoxide dehydrogenase medium subunit
MKPAPFDYHRPTTVAEAVQMLGDGEEVKALAGGQSLVPLLNMRLAQPTDLVDLATVDGLDQIARDGDLIRIGAMVRQAQAKRSEEVSAGLPLLTAALGHLAHPQIRSRGTIGGSIAHADPAAELPAVLLALGGEVVIEGPAGQRTVQAPKFFQGFLTTALEPDEILVEVAIPAQEAGAGWACVEVARRGGDYALGGAMALLRIDDGVVNDARIVAFALADVPLRVTSAEQVLIGQPFDEEVKAAAGTAASEQIDPSADLQSTAAYRSHLASVVVTQALEQAAERIS